MPSAVFRFYAELNFFLPVTRRYREIAIDFDAHQTVKHLIESLGVPHTEVDLILVNGASVDFGYQPRQGDRISVFPVFETLEISPLSRVRTKALRDPKFVLDTHLGRLAAYLRLLGFDALYRNDYEDETLADVASREKRILLTRDRGLLKRNQVTHGYCLRSTNSRQQAVEVLRRFDLVKRAQPFQRCARCNTPLQPVEKSEILEQLNPNTRKYFHEFKRCPGCSQIYWKGSHYIRMNLLIEGMLQEANLSG